MTLLPLAQRVSVSSYQNHLVFDIQECNKEVVISSTNRAQEIIVIRRGYMQRLDTTIESFLRRESKNSILQHLNPTGQELGQEDFKLVDQLVGSAPLSPDLLYPDVPATKQVSGLIMV